MRGSQHSPLIRGDFSLHLLTQIEMLRGDISHEELSKRLGDVMNFCRVISFGREKEPIQAGARRSAHGEREGEECGRRVEDYVYVVRLKDAIRSA